MAKLIRLTARIAALRASGLQWSEVEERLGNIPTVANSKGRPKLGQATYNYWHSTKGKKIRALLGA